MAINNTDWASLSRALEPLGSAMGAEITPSDDGECELEFEGEVIILLTAVPGDDALLMRAPVCSASTSDLDTMRAALEINTTGLPPGLYLAIEPLADEFRLTRRVAYGDAEALPGLVGEVIALVPELRARLALSVGADERADSGEVTRFGHAAASALRG